MLDVFIVTTLGGIVLYEKNFIKLKNEPVNQYINEVIIENRPMRSNGTFHVGNHAFKSLLDVDSGILFIAGWQKSLQIDYIDQLLLRCKKLLQNEWQKTANGNGDLDFECAERLFADQFPNLLANTEQISQEKSPDISTRKDGDKSKQSGQTSPEKFKVSNVKSNSKKAGKTMRKWGDSQLSEEELRALDFSESTQASGVDAGDILSKEEIIRNFERSGRSLDVMEMEYNPAEIHRGDSTVDQEDSSESSWFSFMKNLSGTKTITADNIDTPLRSMNEHLVKKNVAREAADYLCDLVSKKLVGTSCGTFQSLKSVLRDAVEDSVKKVLTPPSSVDILQEISSKNSRSQPYVITFVGVNGVGKSTNLSKVCFWLLQNNLSVLIAACDTFRSGAVEQLNVHVNKLQKIETGSSKIELFQKGYGKDAASIAKDAIKYASERKFDVVLIDTAGRMQDNEPLMRALSKLVAVNRPDKIFFVGEALVGNEAVDQLKKFNQALIDYSGQKDPRQIDAIILSKFDTVDDKVGAAISMTYITGKPVIFVGTGQTYTDLKKMNIKYVAQILMK